MATPTRPEEAQHEIADSEVENRTRPHPQTKNYRQLWSAESGKIVFPVISVLIDFPIQNGLKLYTWK